MIQMRGRSLLGEGDSEVKSIDLAVFPFLGAVLGLHGGDFAFSSFLNLLDDHSDSIDLTFLCQELHFAIFF